MTGAEFNCSHCGAPLVVRRNLWAHEDAAVAKACGLPLPEPVDLALAAWSAGCCGMGCTSCGVLADEEERRRGRG